MRKLIIIAALLLSASSLWADTQDYVKGKVILIKSDVAYFDVGEKDGVAVGERFEIYYDQRVVAEGKIGWTDRNISRTEPLDSSVVADIYYYKPLTVKIRLYVAQANRGGFLNVAYFTDLHLDPATISTPDDKMVSRLIYRGLVARGLDGQILPDLAGDYEIRDLTYTFYLKPDARFHSGRPVEAEDVAYSLEQLAISPRLTTSSCFVLEIKGAEEYRNHIKNEIAGIFIIDRKIIAITLRRPFPSFEDFLASPAGYIIPRPGMVSLGGSVDGAGPYKIKWRGPDGTVLEPFETTGDAAFLDSLRFVRFNSLEEAGLSFELARLDIIPLLGEPPPKFVTKGNFTSQNTSTSSYVILGIDNSREFQNGELFGKALSFLIDRDAIMRVILGGAGTRPLYELRGQSGVSVALSTPFLPDSADYYLNSINTMPEYLGLYVDSSYPVLLKVARYIEGQLLNKGIKIVEKKVDLTTLEGKKTYTDLDMYLTCYSPVSGSPDCFFYPLYSYSLSGQTNFLNFNDQALQVFLNDIHSEPDPGRRDNLAYGLAQSLTNNPPAVILYQPVLTTIIKADISGLRPDPSGYLDLRQAFIEIAR